jgi:hypothetical protein
MKCPVSSILIEGAPEQKQGVRGPAEAPSGAESAECFVFMPKNRLLRLTSKLTILCD